MFYSLCLIKPENFPVSEADNPNHLEVTQAPWTLMWLSFWPEFLREPFDGLFSIQP